METYLLDPTRQMSLQNACDGGGYRRFAVIKKSEGSVGAAVGRSAEGQRYSGNIMGQNKNRMMKEDLE